MGYAGLVGLLLFGAGYVGAQHIRRPAQIVIQGLPDPSPSTQAAATPSAPAELRPGKRAVPHGGVHLNKAGLEELETLPGVGPVTAQKILDFRKANGPFRSVDELTRIKGIGEKKLKALRGQLSL